MLKLSATYKPSLDVRSLLVEEITQDGRPMLNFISNSSNEPQYYRGVILTKEQVNHLYTQLGIWLNVGGEKNEKILVEIGKSVFTVSGSI